MTKKFKRKRPRKGDKVVSPYAGMELNNNKTAPEYGIIDSGARKSFYVDYGTDDHATEESYLDDLVQIKDGVWMDMSIEASSRGF